MKRLWASLAVEAAFIFPLVILLLLSLMQVGLFLSLKQWAQVIAEQGVEWFEEGVQKGKSNKDLETELTQKIEAAVQASVLDSEKSSYQVLVSSDIFGPKITVQMSLVYEFLFPQTILVEECKNYYCARDFRDLIQIALESSERIPQVKEWINQYKGKIKEWVEKLK